MMKINDNENSCSLHTWKYSVVFSSSLLYKLMLPRCQSSKLMGTDLSAPKLCVCISAFQLVMMDGPAPSQGHLSA